MLGFFIDDGYTATKTLDAVPGLHPEAVVTYRPALARQRTEFQFAGQMGAEKSNEAEERLLVKQMVSLNGTPLNAETVKLVKPALRAKLLELVLGYTGEDADAKNSPGG